jgi:LacI family transcriptional regulator
MIEGCESESADEQAEATRHFAATNVEGVILPPPLSESQAILTELAAADIPVVTVAMGRPRVDALNIRIDDFGAAEEITEHLIGLGHRNIGLIKGHPAHIASIERARGFRSALEKHGLDPDTAAIEQGYFTFRSGLVASERLLARPEPPTAIFACNDDMAAAAMSVAHRNGLAIPDDLSIVGFDDTAPATTVWPELTTVRQPISAMAEAALDLLLAGLRIRRSGGAIGPAERVLEHQLIIRQSAARPPLALKPLRAHR